MSNTLLHCYTALLARWADLTSSPERDRGEGPLSTAIIVVTLAIAAVTLAVAITAAVTSYQGQIPTFGAK